MEINEVSFCSLDLLLEIIVRIAQVTLEGILIWCVIISFLFYLLNFRLGLFVGHHTKG